MSERKGVSSWRDDDEARRLTSYESLLATDPGDVVEEGLPDLYRSGVEGDQEDGLYDDGHEALRSLHAADSLDSLFDHPNNELLDRTIKRSQRAEGESDEEMDLAA